MALATEETFAGYSYDLQADTILAKEGGTLYERRYLTTVCDEYDLRVLVTKYDVATACSCFGSLLTAFPFGSGQIIDVLAREDECCGSVRVLHSHTPCDGRFLDIAGAEYTYAVSAMVVLELLHQADLCFLFYRLMGRTIFTDTEGIMRPDELHGELHEGCHTDSGLHVVREDKEGTAGSDDTTMKSHTDTEASHSELSYTWL